MADNGKARKILVAVDESEESIYALSWCITNIIHQNSKDTLILLYVKPPRVLYTALDGSGEDMTAFAGTIVLNLRTFPVPVAPPLLNFLI